MGLKRETSKPAEVTPRAEERLRTGLQRGLNRVPPMTWKQSEWIRPIGRHKPLYWWRGQDPFTICNESQQLMYFCLLRSLFRKHPETKHHIFQTSFPSFWYSNHDVWEAYGSCCCLVVMLVLMSWEEILMTNCQLSQDRLYSLSVYIEENLVLFPHQVRNVRHVHDCSCTQFETDLLLRNFWTSK